MLVENTEYFFTRKLLNCSKIIFSIQKALTPTKYPFIASRGFLMAVITKVFPSARCVDKVELPYMTVN